MAKVRLWNLLEEATRPSTEVRLIETEGLVDTGATAVVLPGGLASELRLLPGSPVHVRYADGRRERRQTGRGFVVEILSRRTTTDAVIEPQAQQILIGKIVLEALDLVVDCKNGSLGPRPESPDLPLLDLY